MSHGSKSQGRSWRERALSLFLAAVLLLGTVPGFTLSTSAHWADEYLDKLVDWGVMRADQTRDPDAPVTRAEFAGIINRAYGYTETGPIPFEDVSVTDWFYDDISIAYTAGYMAGTSETTASPNDTLTREMAVCILGRNMMMKDTPGESLAFSDSRDVSFWAQGMVKTAVDNYIISGYPDNSFGPQDAISRAQMAVLVSQCVGTPVSESGTYELGGVFGNVTITAPNTTLRNTTISGDLYVSGGVGLGGIKLENVNVLGRIIISGTGESEAGDASVVMRNVTANEMLVDNMRNKTVTIRADGITDIAKTVVRTNAYLEDNNTDDKGLMSIELDGETGTRLTLAGRIKEVVDKTPNSYVQVGKGSVAKLTVDEAAINSTIQLDRNTEVKEMNLDVATNVTGEGDIEKLNVNAPGSVVAMLPDEIYIRPGLTASIAGVIMDHTAAEEGSLDPRLLSGYPAASDIAPTGFRADFAGNKKGTIYWAVSNITDGSIGEDDLISPPSYGSKAIRNGSVAETVGGAEVTAQVTGLTVGGAYYLSAILVDEQGNRSPVKVISFSTPDNTVPAFGQGYPYMSFVGKENVSDNYITAQVAVLATKTCRMYYAVLPQGAAAPTENELKAAAVSGNLGYGVMDLVKNEAWTGDEAIIVSRRLEELKDYVLYLWLTDVDGTNSSAVTSLPFRTPDVTPPVYLTEPYENREAQANSVQLGATLNENGTIFWVVVESGATYPKPNSQNETDNTEDGRTARLDSDYAKLQVANGMGALRNGRVNATANTEVNINITGLQPEMSYDLYYLAQDTAGNYSITVKKLQGGIRTLDTSPPTVQQTFSRVSGGDNTRNPMRNSDIILEFSEYVRFTNAPDAGGRDLLALYTATQEGSTTEQETARKILSDALKQSVKFYDWTSGIQRDARIKGDVGVRDDNWQIDYDVVTVTNVGGKIRLTFPGTTGLNLASGGTYSFSITGVEDLGGRAITPDPVDFNQNSIDAGHNVPRFTVVFAQVQLTDQFQLSDSQLPQSIANLNKPNDDIGDYKADLKFRMIPNSTSTVAEGICYDLLLWTNTNIEFDLYYRVVNEEGEILTLRQDESGNYLYLTSAMEKYIYTAAQNGNGWITLNPSGTFYANARELPGKSLHKQFAQGGSMPFPEVRSLDEDAYYEFVISIRKMGTASSSENPDTWSGEVNLYVDVAASNSSYLADLGDATGNVSSGQWQQFLDSTMTGGGGESIGQAVSSPDPNDPKRLYLHKTLTDSRQPVFDNEFPKFEVTDKSVEMNLTTDRPGTIYYAIAPAHSTANEPEKYTDSGWSPVIRTLDSATGQTIQPSKVPGDGIERNVIGMPTLITPDKLDIFAPDSWDGRSQAKVGSVDYLGVAEAKTTVTGLEANRTYYVYVTIKGSGPVPSTLEIYKFKTNPVERPKILLEAGDKGVNMTIDNMDATLNYLLYLDDDLKKIKYNYVDEDGNEQQKDWVNLTLKDIAADGVELGTYANYTVLQALSQGYQSSNPLDSNIGYSLFDIYASTEAKQLLVDWITRNALPSPELTAEGTVVSAQRGTHNMREDITQLGGDNASYGSTYYILTIARGSGTTGREPVDTIYSFRTLPFILTDREPPNLTRAEASVKVDSSGKYITGGTITLYFDKKIFTEGDLKEIESEDDFFGSDRSEVSAFSVRSGRDTTMVIITLATLTSTELTLGIPGQCLANSGGAIAPEDLSITVTQKVTGTLPDGSPVFGQFINVLWGGENVLVGGPDKPVT